MLDCILSSHDNSIGGVHMSTENSANHSQKNNQHVPQHRHSEAWRERYLKEPEGRPVEGINELFVRLYHQFPGRVILG